MKKWAYSDPCQRSTIEGFVKIIVAFNYFRNTLNLKNLLEGSEYLSSFKYVMVLNIPELSICQGFEFPEKKGSSIFVNMTGF